MVNSSQARLFYYFASCLLSSDAMHAKFEYESRGATAITGDRAIIRYQTIFVFNDESKKGST